MQQEDLRNYYSKITLTHIHTPTTFKHSESFNYSKGTR